MPGFSCFSKKRLLAGNQNQSIQLLFPEIQTEVNYPTLEPNQIPELRMPSQKPLSRRRNIDFERLDQTGSIKMGRALVAYAPVSKHPCLIQKKKVSFSPA